MPLFDKSISTSSSTYRALPVPGIARALPLNLLFVLLLSLFSLYSKPSIAAPRLQLSAPEISTAGFYQLQWHKTDAVHFFQLLESTEPSFRQPRIIYRGMDTASHISGKANGTYYYRVIAFSDEGKTLVSNDIKVSVQHHSLAKALLFFGIGAIVFFSIVVTIQNANRRQET